MEKLLAENKIIKKRWNEPIVISDKVFEGFIRRRFINDKEVALRKKLFEKAMRGNIEAQKELKTKYRLTGIWNGKEMVKI